MQEEPKISKNLNVDHKKLEIINKKNEQFVFFGCFDDNYLIKYSINRRKIIYDYTMLFKCNLRNVLATHDKKRLFVFYLNGTF